MWVSDTNKTAKTLTQMDVLQVQAMQITRVPSRGHCRSTSFLHCNTDQRRSMQDIDSALVPGIDQSKLLKGKCKHHQAKYITDINQLDRNTS